MTPSITSFAPPSGYSRVKVVHSFDELVTTPFADGVNALCWARTLTGNFAEVLEHLKFSEGINPLDEALLRSLPLSAEGRMAVEVMMEDQNLLRSAGLEPVLDCICGYPQDDETEIVSTDVYSFHADSAPVEADTYLCSYNTPSSQGLRNEDARRRVDIPETRAALLENWGGEEDDAFREYLRESCYDLHYAALPGAEPFCFGVGNLWRIAVEYPGSPVPPCIHRAPRTHSGQPPRLLLIS